MLKRILICASMTSIMAGLSSCSNDIEAPATGQDGMVVFTAKMPGRVNSRAYSDGTGADKLSYAVYEAGTQNIIYSSDQNDAPQATYNNDLTFTLSLQLVKGQNYDFVFWADNSSSSAYTFDPATQSVSVSYDGIKGNDETRDAFFTAEKGLLVTGAMQKNIQLYRPFAQLNIGTNDMEEAERAGIVPGKTQVVVKDVYSALNLFTGEASGAADVTYAFAELPEGENFPVAGYDYLSMNYILTGEQILDDNVNSAQKETRDITIAIQDENGNDVNSFNVSAVPFQRNYRTNIYGSLLTSTVDFVIEVVPDYNEPDNDYPVEQIWQGDVVKPIIPADKVLTIKSANEFAGLAQMVKDGDTDFEGVTINLEADLDFNNIDKFEPIGAYIDSINLKPFKGTFNGNGHTLSNILIPNKTQAAPFGYITGSAVVKDLVIENINVTSKAVAFGYAAGAVGLCHNGATIQNVTVRNSVITSYKKCGGITGFFQSNILIENCKVENCVLEVTNTEVGGLFGSGTYGAAMYTQLNNNSVSGCEIITNATNADKAGLLSGGVTGTTPNDEKVLAYNTNNTATDTRIILKATTSSALKDALAKATDGTEIRLGSAQFSTKDIAFPQGKTLTITGEGAENTFINAEPYVGANNCDLTFNNLSIVTTKMAGTELGFTGTKKAEYNNVAFKGETFNYAYESETYNNCTFEPNFENGKSKYSVWCYGAKKSVFNNCTFNNNVGKGILVYNHGDRPYNYEVEVNDCTFNVTSDGETTMRTDKGAIEIHTEQFATTTGVVKISNTTYPAEYYGNGLWNELNNSTGTPTDFFTIIVDGNTVQEGSR